jgi:hypothetical protein
MSLVQLIASQPIAGAKTPDGAEHSGLELLTALEIRLPLGQARQKLSDQGADRGVTFGRPDAGSPVHRVGK